MSPSEHFSQSAISLDDLPRSPRSPLVHLKPANSTFERACTVLFTGSFNAERSTTADWFTYCKYDTPAMRHNDVPLVAMISAVAALGQSVFIKSLIEGWAKKREVLVS